MVVIIRYAYDEGNCNGDENSGDNSDDGDCNSIHNGDDCGAHNGNQRKTRLPGRSMVKSRISSVLYISIQSYQECQALALGT